MTLHSANQIVNEELICGGSFGELGEVASRSLFAGVLRVEPRSTLRTTSVTKAAVARAFVFVC